MFKKFSSIVVLIAFACSFLPSGYADVFSLPSPGKPVYLSQAFQPVMLQGIKIDPHNPLHLDFILDTGDGSSDTPLIKAEASKLVRYFLASLTVPNNELWVNLSPYEKNRIIPQSLSLTEMGGELLAQDYMLKQLTASLMGPDQAAGKQFWSQIYSKADQQYGNTKIPLDIFNKIWIVPDKATIDEYKNTAVIVQSHLKVMLEQDYLSMQKHEVVRNDSSMANALIRKLLLPEIEKEVNEGQNFAGVRQVNNALILAAWFKQNLKQSLLGEQYANRNKVIGIDLQDRKVKQEIYGQYLKAFKKGVYNYIKEDVDTQSQQVIARKYFLGGYNAAALRLENRNVSPAQIAESLGDHSMIAEFDLEAILAQPEASKLSQEERLSEIQHSHYNGFPLVQENRDIPDLVKVALFYYDLQDKKNNPLRALIKEGRLRAGPDNEHVIKAVQIPNAQDPSKSTILVSTDPENTVGSLIGAISGKEIADKEKTWEGAYRRDLTTLSIQTSGVIAKPIEVLNRYGIFDLFKDGQGGFRTITIKDIVDHVQAYTPNRQYIHGVMRSLNSLGWLKRKGKSASDDMRLTLTPKGQIAMRYLNLYAKVADFVPTLPLVSDYLFNRPGNYRIKAGTLKELVALAQKDWGIPDSVDAQTAEQIKGNLNGYLVGNIALAFYLDRGTIEKTQVEEAGFDWDQVRQTLAENRLLQIKRSTPEKIVLVANWELEKEKIRGLIGQNFSSVLEQIEGVYDLFNSAAIIDLNDIIKVKRIKGNADELKAAFDLFTKVGFLTALGEGRYEKTAEGLIAFDRVLAYGVPFSYRPSYDLAEEFLFGDAKAIPRRDKNGDELLVYRYLNVLGSGASHAGYFRRVDQMIKNMMAQRLRNGEILSPDLLSREHPFVLAIADTGCGDGTFLAHIRHVIMHNTVYGRLMEHFPELYKLELVGIDYNEEARDATRDNLRAQGIDDPIVIFGDISDPWKIVHDVDKNLKQKFQRQGIESIHPMVIHTRTFLDHNRPWKEVEDKLAASVRGSKSTGAYGWQGEAISNDDVEQNLLEHFKAWAAALASVGQKDLINIELHTIDPDIAADSIGTTLDVPYYLSHMFSDQFIVELPIYLKVLKEAGFQIDDNKVNHIYFPPNEPQEKQTISVDYLKNTVVAAGAHDAALVAAHHDTNKYVSHLGGIDLNPDLDFIRVNRSADSPQTAFELKALQYIKFDGIQPILIKLTPLNAHSLDQ